ncbi:MSMEG_0569 family flavin-dependent oxidoreductase [Kovacikia minuta CCNUW1]|uniref:MSMEG_0569 family flavin-dependent oxidoreductase n=1 Tax=Kovacikia minuta TaxID=2931930 RepID=UPI001CCC7883|nr:MSMEG_0569 family flavin-dependent oxidoreductase [Kovacikia minuta]UBF26819.1 MSMEG_0569 family flavin-dependent oxidoreductase [Kovacikia minuta CCNUW1]
MKPHYSVVIVGGGQAGLSMSYCLKEREIDHIVFEKNQIGHSWRSQRWDSFCLVTPNWQCQLPGYPYPGDEPNGFMQRDEIVQYIENYAASFNPLVMEGVEVSRIRRNVSQTGFELATSIGDYTADQVVIAVGGYHLPKIPKLAERLPEYTVQLHSSEYKNPESLPNKSVLVVGTGQSGCQIAEDLHLAGKQVHLCVGSAPRSPRRYRGKDVVDWLDQMGYYDLSIDQHPQKEKVRTKANHYVTGRGGGREIDLRQFALEGMQLHGRLKTIRDSRLEFWDDLQQNLDQADAVAESIKKSIDAFIEKNQIQAPVDPPYAPVWKPTAPMLKLDLEAANIGAVIWCTGYESDFSWIEVPVFDGKGYPGHDRGVTGINGFYFLGLPWLYTWGSGRFSGIARDANYLADTIATRKKRALVNDWSGVNEFLLGS